MQHLKCLTHTHKINYANSFSPHRIREGVGSLCLPETSDNNVSHHQALGGTPTKTLWDPQIPTNCWLSSFQENLMEVQFSCIGFQSKSNTEHDGCDTSTADGSAVLVSFSFFFFLFINFFAKARQNCNAATNTACNWHVVFSKAFVLWGIKSFEILCSGKQRYRHSAPTAQNTHHHLAREEEEVVLDFNEDLLLQPTWREEIFQSETDDSNYVSYCTASLT